VAWFATMLVGHPFYELYNLRRETAMLLHLYDPPGADSRATISRWVEERATAYLKCAAKLFAFSSSQAIVTALAGLPPLRWRPKEAAEQLWQLAPLGPGAPERRQLRLAVATALNLKI
jgi:hypothetical protein